MKEDGFPETTIIPDENLIELFITVNEEDISLEDYAPYNEAWCLQGRISVKDLNDRPDKEPFLRKKLSS